MCASPDPRSAAVSTRARPFARHELCSKRRREEASSATPARGDLASPLTQGDSLRGKRHHTMTLTVRASALIKAFSKSSPILDRVWAFHVRDSTPPNLYCIPYPSLFRSAARDQISQSKCPYAKTISNIGEDFEMTLIKAVERTGRSPVEV